MSKAIDSELQHNLKQYFGHDTFLEGQEDVVARLMAGEDLCVIMPTGAGKSLCYQLPAISLEGYTLVISPLISLMKDQVDALRQKGLAAACINSTLTGRDRAAVMDDWLAGNLKLLYVSPERLRVRDFRRAVYATPPRFMVIDEAHCISQWGHDFRPDYARIGDFIDELGIKQVGAFTATATPVVREDIVRQLHRPEMQSVITGFTRPNLRFQVARCRGDEEKLSFLHRQLSEPKPTIIYASTRKNVDTVADELQCLAYHAGLDDRQREEVQDRFMSDECPVIVATNAFGMGIDRSDIRRVVHYNIPSSLEAYYQEAGRAGRDGEDAECHLLFSQQDRHVHEFLIELSHPSEFVVHATWQQLLQLQRRQGGETLEISQTELAKRVPGCKGDSQIGAALKLLEKHGYLERGYRQSNQGTLCMLRSASELRLRYPKLNTQRALLVRQVLHHFGDEALQQGVRVSYRDLERLSRLKPEQVKRVLQALNGKDLDWEAPFAGRGLTLLKAQELVPEIDFTEQKRHLRMEMKRLDDMMAYPVTSGCRQRYIVAYFGQAVDGWICQTCDRCAAGDRRSHRAPTTDEHALIAHALVGVQDLGGRFGKNRIAQFLNGSRSKAIVDAGLHRRPSHGSLSQLDQATLGRLLESLTDAGCLEVIGDRKYPLLKITQRGREVLAGREKVQLDFHHFGNLRERGPTPAAAEDAVPGEMDDLFERLRDVRNELAAKRHRLPFQILTNKVLKDLAAQAPLTVEEAQSIKGIGPRKSKTVLPPMLDAIKQWRQETSSH